MPQHQLSLEAYWTVEVPTGQRAVLAALLAGPATDEQLAARLAGRLTGSGCRGRRAELVQRGLVRAVSHDGRTASGRRCSVWALAPGAVETARSCNAGDSHG